MGKCVVCSKSAGPFNSLHKTCLPTYQGVRKCLHETISESIQSNDQLSEPSFDPVFHVQSCKPSMQFSEQQFKKLILQAWLQQAETVIKNPELNPKATKNLLSIANKFSISSQDVDDFLLLRLSHVEHLDQIQTKKTLDKKFDHVPKGIVLDGSEIIIWEFNDVTKTEQQRYSQDKQWTVFRSVLNNILMKKRYKELALKINESGTLLVTNLGLYYKDKDRVTRTRFSQIHSLTPMRNGVRIQANTTGAMPDTYITGDGRFTYALLHYAQELNA